MDNALAVQTAPAAIEKAQNTQLELNPTMMLDRENLQFFANMIEAAELIPKGQQSIQVRKSRVMAKICAGIPHGFDPISAQQNLDIIDGKIGLNARGIEVKLSRTGHAVRIEYLNDTGCKLAVVQNAGNGKWNVIGHVEFNEEMAKKAGLIGKPGDMYKKWGPDMYFARCITRVGKRLVPEAMDTATVAYNLAKREEPTPEQIPEPSRIEEKAPPPDFSKMKPGDVVDFSGADMEYPDQEYSGMPEAEADFIEADEPEPEDAEPAARSEESILADLHTAITDRASEIGIPRYEEILAGRKVVSMDKKALTLFLKELNK